MTRPSAQPSEAELAQESNASRVSADHPGVNELFAVLAYGEIAAFYRLTDEARMAPDLRGRVSMASVGADVEVRFGAGKLPPADHAEYVAGSSGEDLRRRCPRLRPLSGDRRRAAR